jgi:hypothetical protein
MDSGIFPGTRGISVGTFDDPNWVTPAAHFWTRSAMHWMAFPTDVAVIESTSQIDATGFVAEHFPPHVHGENCPACVFADLSRLPVCCDERDFHILMPFNDRVLIGQCLNPTCNKLALALKRP